jgi:hypothetical protein
MNLWAAHDFAAMSCCDLDLQSSKPNVARDTSIQYNDYLCVIVVKLTTNNEVMDRTQFLLQCHAMTLTFKVATEILHATRRLNIVINSVK